MTLIQRIATLALIALPYLGMFGIIDYCRTNKRFSLYDQLEITPLQRNALMVHFWYFISVPVAIEAFSDAPGVHTLVGPAPEPSNVLFMLTCLAAENFFVTSASLGMIMLQDSVPRWALITPFAQLAWNLKNHLAWFCLGKLFAPEGPLLFALLDISLIWPIVAVYAHHFLTAKTVDRKSN